MVPSIFESIDQSIGKVNNKNNLMSSPHVWVQLYYEEQKQALPHGVPIKVKAMPDDVADLTELLTKEKAKKALEHCDALNLKVYTPDTEPPFSEDKALKAWDAIPSNSSGPQPLIVVAPDPKQADGMKSYQECLIFFVEYIQIVLF